MPEREDLARTVFGRAEESKGQKRLSCADAFELASEFEVEIREIGRICNQQKIKISKCQLGCF